MDHEQAISLIVSEAYAEEGTLMLIYQGDDPGYSRLERLIAAVNFLSEELSGEQVFNGALIGALFNLATVVPEELLSRYSPIADLRCSLFQQTNELAIAILELMETWASLSNVDALCKQDLLTPPDQATSNQEDVEFEGLRVGDITYCINPTTDAFFPVKVIRLGFNVIEVDALDEETCRLASDSFLAARRNRCFQVPKMPGLQDSAELTSDL